MTKKEDNILLTSNGMEPSPHSSASGNGVRQGAVLSAILYCFYVKDLFKILRRNGSGCWIDSNYFGIIGYSDDTFLLAPSLEALQEMVKVCENYADIHNLTFSTDKNVKRNVWHSSNQKDS